MKLNRFFLVAFILLLYYSFPSIAQNRILLPRPEIVYGDAIICGEIDVALKDSLGIRELQVIVNSPFVDTNESRIYKININNDGSFSSNIPLICEGFMGVTTFYDQTLLIGIAPNQMAHIHIFINKRNQIEIEYDSPLGDSHNEMGIAMVYYMELWNSIQNSEIYSGPFSSFEEFSRVKINAHERMVEELKTSELTPKGKQWVTYILNMFTVDLFLSYYDKYMVKNDSCNNSHTSGQQDDVKSQLNLFFYPFLKQLDLNDSYYLYSMYYQRIIGEILDSKIFNLPDIDRQPLTTWITTVKDTLKDMLGFDRGLFYDMLAVSAYYRNIWLRHPLTETQTKGINDYFTNRAFVQYLLNQNEERLRESEKNKSKRVVIVPTPLVLNGNVLDAIVEKYRGKVVFVDFWATWCAPCLAAMPEEEEAKEELKGMNDVVYVYLTNTSSSLQKWKAKIQGLDGEHYYLDAALWESAMEQLGFTGIPSYVIYDKTGKLIHKQTMFMGKEDMVKRIKELR